MPMLDLSGPSGRIEALLDKPAPAGVICADGLLSTGHSAGLRAAVVFAHPHTEMGGTMHTKVVYQAAKALSRIGCAVLRFNFRGAGKSAGAFSNGPGEMEDFRSALDYMGGHYPAVPLWAGGMSFGSWIGMKNLWVAAFDPADTAFIFYVLFTIFLGLPLAWVKLAFEKGWIPKQEFLKPIWPWRSLIVAGVLGFAGNSGLNMFFLPIDPENPCARYKEVVSCQSLGGEEVNGRSAMKWEFIHGIGGKRWSTYEWIDSGLHIALKRQYAAAWNNLGWSLAK